MINPIISYPTKAGLALIAKAIARGQPIEITRAAVGQGRTDIPFDELTDLVEPIPEAGVWISDKVYAPGNPSANITVQATLGGMPDGYTYTEVAIYARDPDLGEILMIYTPRYEYPAVVFPGGAGTISETTIVMAVSGVPDINITVSPGALLTAEAGDGRYSLLGHRHPAAQIDESTGETVEESQRRQDALLDSVGQGAGMTIFQRYFKTTSDRALWVIQEGIVDGAILTTGGVG